MRYYAVFKNCHGLIAEPVILNSQNRQIAYYATDSFVARSKQKTEGTRCTDWFLAFAASKEEAVKIARGCAMDRTVHQKAHQLGGGWQKSVNHIPNF